jgi:hypothetical protein
MYTSFWKSFSALTFEYDLTSFLIRKTFYPKTYLIPEMKIDNLLNPDKNF